MEEKPGHYLIPDTLVQPHQPDEKVVSAHKTPKNKKQKQAPSYMNIPNVNYNATPSAFRPPPVDSKKVKTSHYYSLSPSKAAAKKQLNLLSNTVDQPDIVAASNMVQQSKAQQVLQVVKSTKKEQTETSSLPSPQPGVQSTLKDSPLSIRPSKMNEKRAVEPIMDAKINRRRALSRLLKRIMESRRLADQQGASWLTLIVVYLIWLTVLCATFYFAYIRLPNSDPFKEFFGITRTYSSGGWCHVETVLRSDPKHCCEI